MSAESFSRKERSNLPQSEGYWVLIPNVGLLYVTKFISFVWANIICWFRTKPDNNIGTMMKVVIRIVDN